MVQKMCKSKKCQRILPEGYKSKYCENCMGKRAGTAKNAIKSATALGSVVLIAVTKGKHGGKA